MKTPSINVRSAAPKLATYMRTDAQATRPAHGIVASMAARRSMRQTLSPSGKDAIAFRNPHSSHFGKQNGQAVLTLSTVRKMRSLYAGGGETHRSLAARYECSYSNAGSVLRKETWRE